MEPFEQLSQNDLPQPNSDSLIPSKYQGMNSELVEEMWQNPQYVDENKNKSAEEKRKQAIEAMKAKEEKREANKRAQINQDYQNLTDSQKKEFPQAQKEAMQIVNEYIQDKNDITSLLPEETWVLAKIKNEYQEAKKKNPDQPFAFKLGRDIDRAVYENLVQNLTFRVLEQNQRLKEVRQINVIRKNNLPTQNPAELNQKSQENSQLLSIEERKKLSGAPAGFELAKIAEKEGVDLSELSREDYVQYAIDNCLRIDDRQLRMATWQRKMTSMEQTLLEREKKRSEIPQDFIDNFHRFAEIIKKKAQSNDQYISEKVRVRTGTADSNSWLFFAINNGVDRSLQKTPKAYISFKDIKSITPDRLKLFMQFLQKNQYQGDVKIFQDLKFQGAVLNDQIVMHANEQAEAERVLKLAEKFFGSELSQKGLGEDQVINGKELSYSQILERKIKDEISKK